MYGAGPPRHVGIEAEPLELRDPLRELGLELLRAGTVWVNTYRAISYMMPFGGMKHSGVGRESGIHAVAEYQETKSVWISTAKGAPANPFVMR